MGFISRKVLPACGNMCVCCPALRPSSRQPVKRYKKLLREIFPKATNGPPNERKIVKLCEYAARNPLRIPKIAKFLEQRNYKELRLEHVNFLEIISLAYSRLLCICKEQMAYFAISLLNVIFELLDEKRNDSIKVIGCHTLTTFIYSQADSTYTHSIEALAGKICILARQHAEENNKRCLQAASLECLSAMVWFMSTFCYIFPVFDEVVHVTLDSYKIDDAYFDDDEGEESHLNWVEVVRSDVRGVTGACSDVGPKYICSRSLPEIKNSSYMSKEESESPEIWAQICMQKIIEMAKESTTVRTILDPMFTYFDTGKHWDSRQGLSVIILSDVSYSLKTSGNDQLVLASIIRHLDHKNVIHDPQMKSNIIQMATGLIRRLGLQTGVADIGIISDLCRHLRKSLQATVDLAGVEESNWNMTLKSSIQDCLLEISKGISDAQPLFDMMTITLEELPVIGTVSRATIGSLLILAHIISSSSVHSHLQVFPESLFLQLLRTMMHPDIETRIGAHQIFCVLLVRNSSRQRNNEGISFQSDYMYEPRGWHSRTTSAFVSATALLEKLRKEKEIVNADKIPDDIDVNGKEIIDEDCKNSWTHKSSPNAHKISCSIIERTASCSSLTVAGSNIVILSDDQIGLLLSTFWIQARQSDNFPSNFEAIAHSLSLTLLSAHLKNSNHHNVVRTFQLLLSLWSLSLDHDSIVPPSSKVSLFTLSVSMLMYGGKLYHIPELCSTLKSLTSKYVDPYLYIGDRLQLCVKPQVDSKEYGSVVDQNAAISTLENLRTVVGDIDQYMLPVIAQSLSNLMGLEVDNVMKQLSETFTPEDGLLFGPNSTLDWFHNRGEVHSDESLSFDEELSRSSSINADAVSASPNTDPRNYVSSVPTLPSSPRVIGVGQLLESALHVAGEVAGTTVSASPLPYGTMAGHCEALGMGTRKKLSSWLSSNGDLAQDTRTSVLTINKQMNAGNTEKEGCMSSDPWLSLRLPPASPFDNFLKAARY